MLPIMLTPDIAITPQSFTDYFGYYSHTVGLSLYICILRFLTKELEVRAFSIFKIEVTDYMYM